MGHSCSNNSFIFYYTQMLSVLYLCKAFLLACLLKMFESVFNSDWEMCVNCDTILLASLCQMHQPVFIVVDQTFSTFHRTHSALLKSLCPPFTIIRVGSSGGQDVVSSTHYYSACAKSFCTSLVFYCPYSVLLYTPGPTVTMYRHSPPSSHPALFPVTINHYPVLPLLGLHSSKPLFYL